MLLFNDYLHRVAEWVTAEMTHRMAEEGMTEEMTQIIDQEIYLHMVVSSFPDPEIIKIMCVLS